MIEEFVSQAADMYTVALLFIGAIALGAIVFIIAKKIDFDD